MTPQRTLSGLSYIEQVRILHPRVAMGFNLNGLWAKLPGPMSVDGEAKTFSFSELHYSEVNPILEWLKDKRYDE
jgi:hypothetical protein